jgi:hypothetical protein
MRFVVVSAHNAFAMRFVISAHNAFAARFVVSARNAFAARLFEFSGFVLSAAF